MWRSRQEKVLHIACNLLLRVELNGGEDEVYSSTFICWAPESGMVHGTLKCPLPTALAPFAGWLPRTERLDCGFIWKVALDIPRSAVQVNQLCIASPSSLGCLLGHFVEARYFWWHGWVVARSCRKRAQRRSERGPAAEQQHHSLLGNLSILQLWIGDQQAWTEYLEVFFSSSSSSSNDNNGSNNTWGILFEAPIPGPDVDPAYGVQHGSDLAYYFPDLLGATHDPRLKGGGAAIDELQTALVNIVTGMDPNEAMDELSDDGAAAYRWPAFADREGGRLATRLSAPGGTEALEVPLLLRSVDVWLRLEFFIHVRRWKIKNHSAI